MPAGKKLYFASDFHLGARSYKSSRQREERIIRWLDAIKVDASEIFLLGDVFDFWFEYKTVVPKGYIRFLGKLAELTDSGIKLYLFKGNHDMWMFDYFVTELNASIISDELVIERSGKIFYLHHGDGLGPGDKKYKFLKKIFRSPLCQWLFGLIPPDLGIGIANNWSKKSRTKGVRTLPERRYEHGWLITHAKELLRSAHYDYFIFGHKHLPLEKEISPNSRYVNLGEWINYNTYAVFDGTSLELKYFEKPE
ncbi:UDP-2,3-diacylglucosamine diphosphatase [Mucilaginibacter segetis]|uniref:UDP-2,3-diacylglucosamine diphosphatase n=1 Tax=Mucilaginibacter segetis TaxID=2793071 RepID=A0A934PVA8_9SPHI|nr:UDP-2,3-diacylglucosamine diphosphatase [Mucilaginibacter segetis]MBK0379745.1 UDP-2,3-diacylglucosamine diphosphatase [Mucilaginibacter segetis]